MSGCMMKGCYHPLNFKRQQKRRRRRWRWVSERLFWVGEQGGRREVEGCSCPWPMSKWRCNVYCEEGSCQLCLLPSQQDGAAPHPTHHPHPACRHRDRERPMCSVFLGGQKVKKKKKKQEKEYFFDCVRSAAVCVCQTGERRASPARARRWLTGLSTWGIEFLLWCKVPVALLQRVTAFLTRSWTDHLYHRHPPTTAAQTFPLPQNLSCRIEVTLRKTLHDSSENAAICSSWLSFGTGASLCSLGLGGCVVSGHLRHDWVTTINVIWKKALF